MKWITGWSQMLQVCGGLTKPRCAKQSNYRAKTSNEGTCVEVGMAVKHKKASELLASTTSSREPDSSRDTALQGASNWIQQILQGE